MRFSGNKKCIFLSWEQHRRTREISEFFGISLFEIVSDRNAIIRYYQSIKESVQVIRAHRPKVLLVQNPSIILSVLAVWLKRLSGYRLVVDAHNEAINPFILRKSLIDKLGILSIILKYIQRKADLTIITNKGTEAAIKQNGGVPFILPDKIPCMDISASTKTKKNSITFICSYAVDEPVAEVIKAAGKMPDSVTIYITGNYKKWVLLDIIEPPPNVVFTGFLSDAEYESRLQLSDVIMDFTTEENCLVCGAYEAVAMQKPLITSNTKALKKYFYKGTYHINHTPDEIAVAALRALKFKDILEQGMRSLKTEIDIEWQKQAGELINIISRWLQ